MKPALKTIKTDATKWTGRGPLVSQIVSRVQARMDATPRRAALAAKHAPRPPRETKVSEREL